MNQKMQYKVVIIQKSIPQYRKKFFELLSKSLRDKGIELCIIYGDVQKDLSKSDTVELEGAIKIQNKVFGSEKNQLLWQPCLKYLKKADLIIVEQASKLLINYILMFQYLIGKKKLCFWGHGKNLDEANANGISEKIKALLSTKVHWWFAYNEFSKCIVEQLGFPKDKITSVQNSIDTKQLVRDGKNVTVQQIERLKIELGIKGKDICVYTGAMYKQKGIDFLLEACSQIRGRNKEFEMIFIGAGPDEMKVRQASTENKWIHYVGPKFNSDKVPYLKMSKLLLLPSAVGLVVLDSFALGLPLVTTSANNHGPEIEYIKHSENGLIVESSTNVKEYVDNILYLLNNEDIRKNYQENCIRDSKKYTLEKMVENYTVGIQKALTK